MSPINGLANMSGTRGYKYFVPTAQRHAADNHGTAASFFRFLPSCLSCVICG